MNNDDEQENTKKRTVLSNPVYGRTVDGVLKAKDNPLMEVMEIADEILMKYCPVVQKWMPKNFFYPVSGSETEVRRCCRQAWDCVVIDPETGKRVKACGVKKYDNQVREILKNKKLGLPYEELATLEFFI
jgi:hypothetical protein